MHIEILSEDSSGKALMSHLLPKFWGANGIKHSWKIHAYKGIGHLPRGLRAGHDAAKRILLDQLPRLIHGYDKTPGIDCLLVVIDVDNRPCTQFLSQLQDLVKETGATIPVVFRLAIEEMEAWYFGDRTALLAAYPKAKQAILRAYDQDSQCGTWEKLADAIHPGGRQAVQKTGGPNAGTLKHEWANRIGPLMTIEDNTSPSFGKLRKALHAIGG